MYAVAGILILLYSQFGASCVSTYGCSGIFGQNIDDYDIPLDANVIFDIIPPDKSEWADEERYDFEWESIKSSAEPFDKYRF